MGSCECVGGVSGPECSCRVFCFFSVNLHDENQHSGFLCEMRKGGGGVCIGPFSLRNLGVHWSAK